MNAYTIKTMIFGLIGAVLVSLPYYAWVFQAPLPGWAKPAQFIAPGVGMMGTFFHEIGHTLAAWFYGHMAFPIFDFHHGGGWAITDFTQNYIILGGVYAALGYGIYRFSEVRWLQICCGALIAFNLATAFEADTRFAVIEFMGPAFEPLVGGFFLARALLDLAPRGALERFLNAFFGFALIFSAMINAWGLLSSVQHRSDYYHQKGAHGVGDFDKISIRMDFLSFEDVATIWFALSVICLAAPFLVYFRQKALENHNM